MNAALGMADAKLAKILSEESPDRLIELADWGFELVKDSNDKNSHHAGYSCFASQPRAHGMLANSKGGHTGNLIEVMSNKLMYSTIVTPDYIAPDLFSQKGYDEMVYGGHNV